MYLNYFWKILFVESFYRKISFIPSEGSDDENLSDSDLDVVEYTLSTNFDIEDPDLEPEDEGSYCEIPLM